MLYIVTYKQEDEIVVEEIIEAETLSTLLASLSPFTKPIVSICRAPLDSVIIHYFGRCPNENYKSVVSDFLSTLPNDIAAKQSIAFGKLVQLVHSLPEIMLRPYYDKIINQIDGRH